jgi:hypothetical protein
MMSFNCRHIVPTSNRELQPRPIVRFSWPLAVYLGAHLNGFLGYVDRRRSSTHRNLAGDEGGT